MTIAIMQPYFLPYIGYFQLLYAVDRFVLYDDVNYINRGWVNRNNILLAGKPHLFTVPLQNASQNKKIYEVTLSEDQAWRKKLLKTIQQAYQKAPHFEIVFQMLESILNTHSESIADLCYVSISTIATYLGLETEIISSSRKYENDLLKGQERILSICKLEEANRYINPIGGQELYDKDTFAKQDIDLYFIKTKPVSYPQLKNSFVPWLSILDVLMFNNKDETRTLLNEFELI
ncbi:WbqC family protein [Arundinibacter roseus]|uniref:WbqC family protein n=1 Tax=Arundinibacter roseus TaxID=2070510 RepID=A0A4V2X9N4_9BACT|nr:WbqC family protein [Arundinibacter roseus]TDB64485.1 hypothetical protein EZE20_12470 [Arundinibacter roseus]